MHPFYARAERVFSMAGSNRSRFCKARGINYHTLQSYWNTDKLPPGNVLEAFAREFHVSLDVLVLGRGVPWGPAPDEWAELEEIEEAEDEGPQGP